MVLTSLIHTPRLTAYPSKEGMRCTRPKVYHSVDDDGSRDVSPLDFLNPLERGATTVAGYAAGGASINQKSPIINSNFSKISGFPPQAGRLFSTLPYQANTLNN